MTDRHHPAPVHAPGSLTTAMRAAAPPATPRALRVGLVHRGRVVEERIFGAGEDVTVGPNERATFVVAAPDIRSTFRLFESAGDGFRLHLGPGMTGRIAQAAGTVDVATLRDRPVALLAETRGKLHVGESVILFQLVSLPPAAARPDLPANMRSGVGDVDWRTSIVAAFSFLVHFGAVGTVYSDWMDPVMNDDVETTQILESVRDPPKPPPLERPTDEPANAAAAAAPRAAPKSAGQSGGGRAATTGGPGGRGGMGDARAHQLSSQMAALEMQMIASLNASSGSATSAVLGPGGSLPLGMLDMAAASASGARQGGAAGLDLGGHSTTVRPGAITRSGLPGDTTSIGPASAGVAASVRPPSGNVPVPPVTQTGGDVLPNAAAVVAAMTPGLRRCYNLGLTREDPTMRGTVRFTVRVGPNGEVLSASASGGGTLSASVVGCMRARVASAQFAAPSAGGGATLVIPVSVTPQ